MMYIIKYRIADFNIELETDAKAFSKIMREYHADFLKEDVKVSVCDDDIFLEKEMKEDDIEFKYLTTYKIAAFHRKIGDWLPSQNAFVLHSACFDVGGEGVAFAAHSGTGKSTHMMLWQKFLGERMTVVNGDKPIVRFFENEPETPYAYGTPWNGKEHLGCNTRTPLKHICFIERSETNYVTPLDKAEATNRMIKQVYMPKDPIAVMNTMQLIDRLLDSCKLWIIHCNMDISAAETAYNAIFGEN